MYGTAGVHPQHAANFNEEIELDVIALIKHGKILCLGECGLDKAWLSETTFQQQEA